jgi:hypothetical protein
LGRNTEADHAPNAVLVESNLTLADRDTWFGRFEVVGKTAHDLHLHDVDSMETFTVAKLQGGYTRYLPSWKGLTPGFGVSVSAGFVPRALETVYGSRVNAGLGVFFIVRPAVMRMAAPASGTPARSLRSDLRRAEKRAQTPFGSEPLRHTETPPNPISPKS